MAEQDLTDREEEIVAALVAALLAAGVSGVDGESTPDSLEALALTADAYLAAKKLTDDLLKRRNAGIAHLCLSHPDADLEASARVGNREVQKQVAKLGLPPGSRRKIMRGNAETTP